MERKLIPNPPEHLDADGLREYASSLLWQYRLMDAFWFIKVEEKFGLKMAETLNERVWAKMGELSARDIVKRFGPFDKGLKGFLSAYEYFPWSRLVDFKFEMLEDELQVTVANCPSQEGRLKHGLGEYSCRDMHFGEFQGFAKVIDPAIRIECLFAPPDPHPEDCHCQWRFTVS